MKYSNLVFLTLTDTTIGFVSQDSNRLNKIKQRPENKKFITALNSLDTLKKFTRVPANHKKMVRRAARTTFIIRDESFRVVKDDNHLKLMDRLKWAYTTSANLSGEEYNEEFAFNCADVIISPLNQHKSKASQILKLGTRNIKRLRA